MNILPILFVLIIVLGLGGVIYYFVFLNEDDETSDDEDEETSNDEDEEEIPEGSSPNAPVVLTSVKEYLYNQYTIEDVTEAINENNTKGAPMSYTCTGLFGNSLTTCHDYDKDIKLSWDWISVAQGETDYMSIRCRLIVHKYIVYVQLFSQTAAGLCYKTTVPYNKTTVYFDNVNKENVHKLIVRAVDFSGKDVVSPNIVDYDDLPQSSQKCLENVDDDDINIWEIVSISEVPTVDGSTT